MLVLRREITKKISFLLIFEQKIPEKSFILIIFCNFAA